MAQKLTQKLRLQDWTLQFRANCRQRKGKWTQIGNYKVVKRVVPRF